MCINFLKIYKEGNSLMEDSMKKFALIAMLVVIAVVLVTCDLLVPEATEEWTDVEYEIEGVVGKERVRSVKIYFRPDNVERSVLPGPNTYGVRVSPEQKRIIRALSADTAAASHDFFEAIFYCSANQIVRTTWEIGYPAGVSGSLLLRGADTGAAPQYNYAPLTTAACGSTVFVGRKANKTLLGVGWLTAVNDTDITAATGNIRTDTYSVTYTVAPLKTWLGYTSLATDTTQVLRQRASFYGNTGTGTATTFVTGGTTPFGGNKAFTPVQGKGSVTYPLFTRPKHEGAGSSTMTGTYTIGGLENLTAAVPAPPYAPGGTNGLREAIRVYGQSNGTGSIAPATGVVTDEPKGGLQVIKRKPAYLFNGRTYQAGSVYDSFTTLTSVAPSTNGTNPTSNDTHDAAFNNVIGLTFNITNQSSGIFAITFQCPVYAITTLNARQPTNTPQIDPNNRFVKWFIRPADGPDLYLLDSGTDEGGMVMLGDIDSLTDDWIEIKTVGIGFQNN
jgi:hypothetical protein